MIGFSYDEKQKMQLEIIDVRCDKLLPPVKSFPGKDNGPLTRSER
jgi:hypothetical protein